MRRTYDLIRQVAGDYPDVPFEHAEAVSAMRTALHLPVQAPCDLQVTMRAEGDAHVLTIKSDTKTFGPQPWLCFKTVTEDYHHDNFDILTPFHEWRYVFDRETFPIRAIEAVGVATNNAYGATTVVVHDVARETTKTVHHNLDPVPAG